MGAVPDGIAELACSGRVVPVVDVQVRRLVVGGARPEGQPGLDPVAFALRRVAFAQDEPVAVAVLIVVHVEGAILEQLLRDRVEGKVHVRAARRVDRLQVVVRVGAQVCALRVEEGDVECEQMLLPDDAVGRNVGLVVAELAADDEAGKLPAPEEVVRHDARCRGSRRRRDRGENQHLKTKGCGRGISEVPRCSQQAVAATLPQGSRGGVITLVIHGFLFQFSLLY